MKRIDISEKGNLDRLDPVIFSELPSDLVEYASYLQLLSEIPFPYLVADMSQLPVESIRFFYIDTNWVNALVSGAFSIGRSCSDEIIFDVKVSTKASKQGFISDYIPRDKIIHQNHKTDEYNDKISALQEFSESADNNN
jgi:hypothetical protein